MQDNIIIGIPRGNPKLIETRQFKHFNTIEFQNNLREAFSNFDHHTDPNIAWHEWKEIFLHIADHHAPLPSRNIKSEYKPWLSNEIKNLSYRRDYLKKKTVSLNSPAYDESYKKCRNQVNRLIKDVKTKCYKINLQNNTNSKNSWKIINELLNKKSKTTTINEKTINHNKVTGDENIANEFNNFFCRIWSELAEDIPQNDRGPLCYVTPGTNVFKFKIITNADLVYTLKEMKASKASGLDKVSSKLLRAAGNSLHESLLVIFNLILNTSIFPDEMKLPKIIPIYKSEEKTDCGKYKPISVISAVAKILEKLI